MSSKYIFILLFVINGCTKKHVLEKPDTPKHLVRVLFSIGGLGDLSFNDELFRGILEEKKRSDFRLFYTCPTDMKQAEEIIQQWQQEDCPQFTYTILSGSEYAGIVRQLPPQEKRKNWLMFDTSERDLNMVTLRYCGYGVSFLAGIAAYYYTLEDSVASLRIPKGIRS